MKSIHSACSASPDDLGQFWNSRLAHNGSSKPVKRFARLEEMIAAKRLKAIKVGREWLIEPKDLEAVENRKVGRPPKGSQSQPSVEGAMSR
jgi:hypothetical protein